MKAVRRGLTLFLALIAGAACTEPGSLRLEISLDRKELTSTDTVGVSLELINVGWAPKTIASPQLYGYCIHAFRIYDAQRREVQLNTALCIAAASMIAYSPIELGPGASVTIRDSWQPSTGRINGQALAPGKYQMVGNFPSTSGMIRSAPADLTLLP